MPIYEYACKTCGKRFERLVSAGKDKDVVCVECGSAEVRKLISGFGIGGGSSRIKASSSSCTSCSTKSCGTCR
jgi:putative FmdB family regulatory protein